MTLDTGVAVTLPIDGMVPPAEMFRVGLDCLLKAAGSHITDPRIETKDTYIQTRPGQGLPAWTGMYFNPNGPYRPEPLLAKDNDPAYYQEGLEKGWHDEAWGEKLVTPACTYLFSFDTAYGYHDEKGGCTALHARTIMAMAEWVYAQGGTLVWENEYDGSWNDFSDEQAWINFAGKGKEAMDWYNNVAKPAITAEIVARGGRVNG